MLLKPQAPRILCALWPHGHAATTHATSRILVLPTLVLRLLRVAGSTLAGLEVSMLDRH